MEADVRPPWRWRAQVTAMRLFTVTLRRLGLRERVLRRRLDRARGRRRRLEAAGDDRLSRPALHDMDRKLDEIIDVDGGFFVEAGANDGYTQSNTYWLERFRGWRGVLVEAMPDFLDEIRANRPRAMLVHAALVPSTYEPDTIRMQFGGLMSTVATAHEDAADWVSAGVVLGWHDTYTADVPARTLSSVLDEVDAPEVDLLSLDVEGFEPQVLQGLDLDRHAPRYLLVEMHDVEAGRRTIGGLLGEHYVEEAQLSPLDVLYRRADLAPSTRS